MLGRGLFDTEDEVQEVVDNNVTNEENTSVVEASTSSSDNPAPKSPLKKITCPICMDDEQTVSKIIIIIKLKVYYINYPY